MRRAPEGRVQPAAQTCTVSLTRTQPWARVTTRRCTVFWTSIRPPQRGQGAAAGGAVADTSARESRHWSWAAWTCSNNARRAATAARSGFFTEVIALEDLLDLGQVRRAALSSEPGQRLLRLAHAMVDDHEQNLDDLVGPQRRLPGLLEQSTTPGLLRGLDFEIGADVEE